MPFFGVVDLADGVVACFFATVAGLPAGFHAGFAAGVPAALKAKSKIHDFPSINLKNLKLQDSLLLTLK